MFLPFFLELKAAKVPVTLREFLTLLEGMGVPAESIGDSTGKLDYLTDIS